MSNPFVSPESFDSAVPANRARVRLKRVGVLSVGVFFGVAGVSMGLLNSVCMLLMSLIMSNAGPVANGLGFPGALFGAGMLIMMPMAWGVMGFMAGAVNAAAYNIVAGFSGGIELELSHD